MPHLHSKIGMTFATRAESLPNPMIHCPLEMRHTVRLLTLKHAQNALFRSHFKH